MYNLVMLQSSIRMLGLIATLVNAGLSFASQSVQADPHSEKTRLVVPLVIELLVPGGALPFECSLIRGSISEDSWRAEIHNGDEAIECNDVIVSQHTDGVELVWDVVITFAHYDTVLGWTMIQNSDDHSYRGAGALTKVRPSGTNKIPILVRSGERFHHIERSSERKEFAGRWRVLFSSSTEPAIAVFDVTEDGLANGTFLTTTGDYRFLAGRVDGANLHLSVFDGAHSFLFHAKMLPDGSIAGDFWSGNWWHETWTATRDESAQLPDAFEGTSWVVGNSIDDLVFSDLDGKMKSVAKLLDEQGGSVRVLEIFGTWCPNCTDAARDLRTLQVKYKDRGFTVLGLAFEHTEDLQRSTRMVRAYKDRFDLDWPILVAGLSNKAKASKVLPFLDRIRTFPTLIFLDEHNMPIAIHAGYTGPATGEAYKKMMKEFETLIESNLK
jgi:thiol-disulfide isomerase/thioredoxin